MTAKAGYKAWRERNLSLPSPDEFRIKRDGSLKVIWRDLERGWYSLYADFTWDADGTPKRGSYRIVDCATDETLNSGTIWDENALVRIFTLATNAA